MHLYYSNVRRNHVYTKKLTIKDQGTSLCGYVVYRSGNAYSNSCFSFLLVNPHSGMKYIFSILICAVYCAVFIMAYTSFYTYSAITVASMFAIVYYYKHSVVLSKINAAVLLITIPIILFMGYLVVDHNARIGATSAVLTSMACFSVSIIGALQLIWNPKGYFVFLISFMFGAGTLVWLIIVAEECHGYMYACM